jgi:hypothetical protein
VVHTNWNFEDEYMWKAMDKDWIDRLPLTQGLGGIQSQIKLDITSEEKNLE